MQVYTYFFIVQTWGLLLHADVHIFLYSAKLGLLLHAGVHIFLYSANLGVTSACRCTHISL